MRNRFIIILFIFVLSSQLYGQIVTVKSAFSSDSILLGEQINYTLSVESAGDLIISLPEYQDTITSEIEILKASQIDTALNEGRQILTKSYTISSFQPGWNTVPPQAIAFQSKEISDTVYTPALLLTVLAPQVDTTLAIKPIKGPVNTPLSFAEILPWALIGWFGFMIITLIIALIWMYTHKGKAEGHFIPKILEPAHIIAFRELDNLEKEKLPQKGKIKEYYTNLTWIIREYISRQFSINAHESTSSEILEAFKINKHEEKGLLELLENLLQLADLVKFAKEDPSMKENELHLKNAVLFVEQTYRMFYSEEDETQEVSEKEKTSDVEAIEMEEKNG